MDGGFYMDGIYKPEPAAGTNFKHPPPSPAPPLNKKKSSKKKLMVGFVWILMGWIKVLIPIPYST